MMIRLQVAQGLLRLIDQRIVLIVLIKMMMEKETEMIVDLMID